MHWVKALAYLCFAVALLLFVREAAPNEPFVRIIAVGTGIVGALLLGTAYGFGLKQTPHK